MNNLGSPEKLFKVDSDLFQGARWGAGGGLNNNFFRPKSSKFNFEQLHLKIVEVNFEQKYTRKGCCEFKLEQLLTFTWIGVYVELD